MSTTHIIKAIEEQSDKFIDDIKKNKSIFIEVPQEIGDLIFCNTTDVEGQECKDDNFRQIWLPMSSDWTMSFNTINDILYEKFTNIDYFIGTEGIALIKFKGKRECIMGKIVILYKDITDIVMNVSEHHENGEYKFTEYEYAFCNINSEGVLSIPYGNKFSFDKRKEIDQFPLDFVFAAKVEHIWSEKRFNKFLSQQNDILYANDIELGDFPTFENRMVINRETTIVNDIEFIGKELESVSISDNFIYFNGPIQKSYLHGLIKKRKKACVYLPSLSNKLVVYKILGIKDVRHLVKP